MTGSTDAAAIGARLREARMLRGLTQADVAERAGVAKRALETWESGTRLPSRALPALALALDVTPEWLLYGSDLGRTPELAELVERLAALETLAGDTIRTLDRGLAAVRATLHAIEARLAVLETPRSAGEHDEPPPARLIAPDAGDPSDDGDGGGDGGGDVVELEARAWPDD